MDGHDTGPPGTWHLEDIRDLRELDWATGKRIPLGPGEGEECGRCGRLHAVVHHLRHDDGRTLKVGSTCSRRATNGWEPTADEKRVARARVRDRVENARAETQDALVDAIVASLGELEIPAPQWLGECDESQDRWGADDVEVWVWKRQGLTQERLDCFRRRWVASQVRGVAPPIPATFSSWTIEQRAIARLMA